MTALEAAGAYAHGMAAHAAVRFRRQAQEALEQAGTATNAIDIKAWLLVAEDWLKVAQAVEAGRSK